MAEAEAPLSNLPHEERIRSRKLTAGERATLLREPFEMADAVLTRRTTFGGQVG